MSASLDYLASEGLGVVVWCSGQNCPRFSTYVPAAELHTRFGRGLTCEEASRRLVCSACGARGREGKVEVLPSTMDVADVRMGRPAGTSEAIRAAKLAEGATRDD